MLSLSLSLRTEKRNKLTAAIQSRQQPAEVWSDPGERPFRSGNRENGVVLKAR